MSQFSLVVMVTSDRRVSKTSSVPKLSPERVSLNFRHQTTSLESAAARTMMIMIRSAENTRARRRHLLRRR